METKDLPGHYRHGGEVRGSRRAAPAKKNAAAMLGSMPQGYADGGVVQAVKGFFGFKKKPEPLPADLNKLPPTGAGPAPAPSQPKPKEEPKKAISQYSGMSALERRMKEADAYADGGMVRGPGTGTSDDVKDKVREGTYIMPADSTKEIGAGALAKMSKVPVKLSNGEYKLTPEQVHAIGVQTLEGMKDATHEPVRKAYADGGVVEDDRAKVSQPVPGVQRQGSSYTATTVADRARQPGFSMGAGTYTPKPAAQPAPMVQQPASAPTTSAQVVRQGNSFSAAPAVPRPVAAPAPSASAAMAAMPSQKPAATTQTKPMPTGWATDGERFMPGVQNVWNESGKAIGDLVGQGRYGAAAGETARAAASYVPAFFDDTIGGAYRSIAPGVIDAAKQFFGAGDAGATAAPAPSAAQKMAAPPAPAQVGTSNVQGGRGNINPAPVNPNTPIPKPTTEIAPGIYRQGNSYGDSPEAAASGARPSQGPSARNISAADVLASRSGQQPADVMGIYARASEALKGVAEAQRALDDYGPGSGGQGGGTYIKHSGNDWETEKNLKNLRTSASSITNRPGRRGEPSVEQQAYLKALDADMAARSGNNPAAIEAMRQQGETARFNAREAGETARAGMRSAADARRDGLAAELGRGKLDLERTAQGYANSSLARQEKLYADYDAAKTPEERAAIAQKIRDLAGKSSQDGRYQLVRGEQVFDEKANALRNTGERLYDTQLGKFVGEGQSAQAQPPKNHIDMLKADPKLASMFDAQYGPGASKQYLAG